MKKTVFEEMGGTYIRQGDYLIPCLTLPEEEQRFIGVWGQRHKRYLKEHKRTVYMKERQGVTEQLKAENQMNWVARMNNIQACAREIVDKEIIFR